jgi:hypothetical protein
VDLLCVSASPRAKKTPADDSFSRGGAEPTEEWEKDPTGRAAEVIATPKRIGHNWTVFRLPADSPALPFPPFTALCLSVRPPPL